MASSGAEVRAAPFEGVRGGVHHRYDVRPDGLHYSATDSSSPKEARIVWSALESLASGHAGELYLVLKTKQEFGVWVAPESMGAFCQAVLREWARSEPEQARAAARRYVEQGAAVGWALIALALVVIAPCAAYLLLGPSSPASVNSQLVLGWSLVVAAALVFGFGAEKVAERRPFREAIRAASQKI